MNQRKPPEPRDHLAAGIIIPPLHWPDGTWMEGEAFNWPRFGRKAFASLPDGVRRLVRIAEGDSLHFGTIPARARIGGKNVRGFVLIGPDGAGLRFRSMSKETEEPCSS